MYLSRRLSTAGTRASLRSAPRVGVSTRLAGRAAAAAAVNGAGQTLGQTQTRAFSLSQRTMSGHGESTIRPAPDKVLQG